MCLNGAVVSVFADRFRVISALGAGGMGAVYEAEDMHTGARVALKLAHGQLLTDGNAMTRFAREARLLAELDHPNVVRVLFEGEQLGRPFLVMELVPGETLGDRIRRGPLSPAELTPVLRAVAFGVRAVHSAGIVHRDLKPSNILLPSDGTEAKVCDFGVAKDLDRSKLTASGAMVGTPRYLAPETFYGVAPSARSDVYALGVVAYEALSARSPLQQGVDTFTAIAKGLIIPLGRVADVPVEVEAVVARAMARPPEGRFSSVVGFAEAYEDAVASAAAQPRARESARPPDAWASTTEKEPASAQATIPTFVDDPTPVG